MTLNSNSSGCMVCVCVCVGGGYTLELNTAWTLMMCRARGGWLWGMHAHCYAKYVVGSEFSSSLG